MKRILLTTVALFAPALAHADDLDKIVGRWSRDADGEVVKIERGFGGWELWHSRYGQYSLTLDGTAGGNIKVSGRAQVGDGGIDCFYYISVTQSGDTMNWALRRGPKAECGGGMVKYSYVPTHGRTHAQEIADAVAESNRLHAIEANGPDDLRGIDVVYFERDADNAKIRNALDLARVAFTARPSDSQMASNVVTCTRDVPIEATKSLLRTLISEKIPIRALRPSQYQQFPKRLTIESLGSWMPSRPLVTLAEVNALTTCNLHNKDGRDLVERPSRTPADGPPPVRVTLGPANGFQGSAPPRPAPPPAAVPVNLPQGGEVPIPASFDTKVPIEINPVACSNPVNVTAKFWSPAAGAWQMTHLKGIYGPTRFKNGDGTDVTTSTREIYFFMRDTVTQQPVTLGRQRATYFPGSDTGYYKGGPSFAMRCGG